MALCPCLSTLWAFGASGISLLDPPAWTSLRHGQFSRAPSQYATAISAATTGVIGILRGQERYGLLAGASALNSGMTAIVFFGLRECVISPVLVHTIPSEAYERRRLDLGIGQRTPKYGTSSPDEFSFMHSNKVLDSAMSGVIAGGLLRGWKSGSRAILSGSVTVGIAATLLQLGYNEFSMQRLKYISRQRSLEAGTSPATLSQHPTLAAEDVGKHTSWKARFLSLLGFRKLSEEEYLTRLKQQREHHLMRIKVLEQKLEEEKKVKENGN